jgi:hypothetical protein
MKKRFSGPQIVAKLSEADRLLGQGKTAEEVWKGIDVTDATYYRWRKKYGGMSPDMIKQLRALQKTAAKIERVGSDVFVTVTSGLGVVLLSKPSCPPKIEAEASEGKISLSMFAPWGKDLDKNKFKASIEAPGLRLKGLLRFPCLLW